MPSPEPVVDLAKIEFPTDKLTLKELRKFCPDDFDRMDKRGRALGGPPDVRSQSEAILLLERDFASRAFNAAMGRPFNWNDPSKRDPEVYDQVNELGRKLLRGAYVAWGLATGQHHAEQLLRAVEQAAAEQAKAYAPPSRS